MPLTRAAVALLALVTVACRAAEAPRPIAVMTLNVRYGTADDGEDAWPNRVGLVMELIRRQAPDVLGLQEALRFQLDAIGDSFPELAEIGVGRDDGHEAGEYAAILYRGDRFDLEHSGTFWFSDTPDTPGSAGWGNRVTRICTWAELTDTETGISFHVFNVHLDHESQASRERSTRMLASRIAARERANPVIVLGDFNAGEDNPAVRFLTGGRETGIASSGDDPAGPPLVDTYRAIHPTDTSVGTYNAFRGERGGEKIDWILVSPQFTVLEAAIVRDAFGGRYPSDHFAVTTLVSPVPVSRAMR